MKLCSAQCIVLTKACTLIKLLILENFNPEDYGLILCLYQEIIPHLVSTLNKLKVVRTKLINDGIVSGDSMVENNTKLNNEKINGINNYIYILKNSTIIDDSLVFLERVRDEWIDNENRYINDDEVDMNDILGKAILNHCNTQVKLMSETTPTRELILNNLLLAFKQEWTSPRWSVQLIAFGSSMSTLGSAGSDLDLCLVINEEKCDSKILKPSSLPHTEILQVQ
jgi:hypothetical protein